MNGDHYVRDGRGSHWVKAEDRKHAAFARSRVHRYRRCGGSGAGNCCCGLPPEWRGHQPWWWRALHRWPYRRNWRL